MAMKPRKMMRGGAAKKMMGGGAVDMPMGTKKMMRGGKAKKMMRKPGSKGAPTNKAFRESAKTAKK